MRVFACGGPCAPTLPRLTVSSPLTFLPQDLRSKTRTIDFIPKSPKELPKWNYDGSSTGQVRVERGGRGGGRDT